jgi:DNA-binding GntR family transcriptional regulator
MASNTSSNTFCDKPAEGSSSSSNTGKDAPPAEHYRILEASRERDVPKAVSLLEQHIPETKKNLLLTARMKEML